MEILAVVNNKGGVGKTTLARILAEYFSFVKNEKVLAIDMDPQGNFSNRFLPMEIDEYDEDCKIPPLHPEYNSSDPEDSDWNGRSSIADIFFGEEVVPYPTHIEKLDILPAHSSKMLLAEAVTRDDVIEKVYNQLSKLLKLDEMSILYDKIIIDTAPSKAPLTRAVIRAATHIVIPTILEPSPLEGIQGLLHLWKSESLRREDSSPIELIGVLANLVDNRVSLHKDYYEELKSHIPEHVLDSMIIRRIAYSEIDSPSGHYKSVFDYPKSHKVYKEALSACEEIELKIGKGR